MVGSCALLQIALNTYQQIATKDPQTILVAENSQKFLLRGTADDFSSTSKTHGMVEPCSMTAMAAYGAYMAFKSMAAYGMKRGSDWYVDSSAVAAVEAIYGTTHDAKGRKIDHRRKPWCTMRRFVTAYKTGNKDKFQELRDALKDLKSDLTGDVQDELAEAAGQGGAEAVAQMVQAVAAMLETSA